MRSSTFTWAASLTLTVSLTLTAALSAAAADARPFGFSLQKRVETREGSGDYKVVTTRENWDPKKTAIIVCDMWDLHHCKNAVKRENEFAPRMNELLENARARGVFVVHAPSSCMKFYEGHPARLRAQHAPKASNLPSDISQWCRQLPAEEKGTYPLDDMTDEEDDDPEEHRLWAEALAAKGLDPKRPWTRQIEVLKIHDDDAITDSGVEVWNLLEARGINDVILMGVHVNKCVTGRPFGLRQMVKNGRRAVLVRDLTDSMYNPKCWPYVDHYRGTELFIEHVEKFICPTLTSDQILGREPFTFRGDPRAKPASSAEPTLRAFDRMVLLEDKGETSASVSLGDLNRDGHLDIVLAKGRHWPLHNRILLNDGTGRSTAANLGDTPDRTYSAAVADLDGDGSLDLVVSNDRPDKKLIYLNDGKARFRVAGTFGDPAWSTRYVTLADLNRDGFPDIIAANRGGGPKSPTPSFVCLNDGQGKFPVSMPLPTESATIIVAADFDGDGAIDLFVPHRDGGQSIILWNSGQGTFPHSTPVGPAPAQIRAAAAGDLDGDGRPDLVVGDEKTKQVVAFSNSGGRAFAVGANLSSGEVPYAIAIADLNRDGKADVIVGNLNARGSVFFNDGSGKIFHQVRWNDGAGAVYGVAAGDLDGDGWPDLVTARSDAPNAIWFSAKPATQSR